MAHRKTVLAIFFFSDPGMNRGWIMVLTSCVHLKLSLLIIAFDNMGSTGNSAILLPSLVNSPL